MSDSHWLNLTRTRIYPKIILALYLIIGLVAILRWWYLTPWHSLIVSDLTVFWIAAQFALSGHAEIAYHPEQLHAAMFAIDPEIQGAYGWFYPPTFYLLVTPLGLLPYWGAYACFMTGSLMSYVIVMRRIIRGQAAMWLLAAFPGIWINLLTGQNGLLTAALAGAALLTLQRHPLLAGVLIGMLAIKPHLAILFPIALIALGAWRTLAVAGSTAIIFMGISVLLLGADSLNMWQQSLGAARHIMENGGTSPMMPTIFALMRLLNVSLALSYVVHATLALVTVVIVWKVCRSDSQWTVKSAAIMTGSLLISPYLMEYDLAWLGMPIVWLSQIGLQSGWLRGDREILVANWLLPLFTVVLAWLFLVQIGPVIILALLWAVVRRTLVPSQSERVNNND